MRPGFLHRQRARADAPSRARIRADWVELLSRAGVAGWMVTNAGALDRPTADDLAHRFTRHGAQPFPLTHASAADAVAGFRAIARGFIASTNPELKAALAPALSAAAHCCQRMLELADAEANEGFRRETLKRLGERED